MSVTKLHHFLANPGRVRLMSNSKDLDVTTRICNLRSARIQDIVRSHHHRISSGTQQSTWEDAHGPTIAPRR